MAIALDAAAFVSLTGDPASGTFTVGAGTDRILVVWAVGEIGLDTVTGATFDGVPMTLIDKGNAGGNRYLYMFILTNPASGSKTLAFTDSGDPPIAAFAWAGSGARQVGQPDNFGKATATSIASLAKTIATNLDNCWLVGGIFTPTTDYTAQSGTTVRAVNPASPNSNEAVFDTNGAKTPPGSYALGIDFDATENDAIMLIASISPSLTAQTSGLLSRYW